MRLFCIFLIFCALMKAQEESAKIDKIVVTATGFEQDADSNLRNVIVVQGDELRNKGYSSLEQALQRAAGISFVNLGVNGNTSRSIDLRGQGTQANASVRIMIDNVALNILDQGRLHSAGVSAKPLDSISLEDIERIEIIPGGGAVLYGGGTRGGVVHIITKKTKSNALVLHSQSQIFENGHFGGEAGISGAYQFTPNITYNGVLQGFYNQGYQDGYAQKGFYQNSKLLFDVIEDLSLNLGFAYFLNNDESSGTLTKKQITTNPTQKGKEPILFKIERPEANVELKYKMDKWNFNLLTFWQNQKSTIKENAKGSYKSDSSLSDTLAGVNFKSKYSYLEDSYLILGYEFKWQNGNADGQVAYIPTRITRVLGDDTKSTHSVFALDTHKFLSWFALSGGARYEYAGYKHHSKSSTSNKVSYDFHADNKTNNFALEFTPTFTYSDIGKVYLKFEKGFITPTPRQFRVSESIYGPNGRKIKTIYHSNPNLKSETYYTYEVGLSDFVKDFLEINLAIYYTQSKDEIRSFGSGHGATKFYGYYNLDETNRYGFDLGLKQYLEHINFYQNLSFVDARINSGKDKGKEIPLVPAMKFTGGFEASILKNLKTFVNTIFVSSAKDEGYAKILAYNLVDFGFIYNINAFKISGGVKNLFDMKYYAYQNEKGKQYLPGDGRAYYLNVDFKF